MTAFKCQIILLTHIWDPNRCYHSRPQWNREQSKFTSISFLFSMGSQILWVIEHQSHIYRMILVELFNWQIGDLRFPHISKNYLWQMNAITRLEFELGCIDITTPWLEFELCYNDVTTPRLELELRYYDVTTPWLEFELGYYGVTPPWLEFEFSYCSVTTPQREFKYSYYGVTTLRLEFELVYYDVTTQRRQPKRDVDIFWLH